MEQEIKIGSKVKMNDFCKKGLSENDWQEHVDEFGDCIGIVEELYPEYSEAKIRWQPSKLNYIYGLIHLDLIK